jgi:hypothetical protein
VFQKFVSKLTSSIFCEQLVGTPCFLYSIHFNHHIIVELQEWNPATPKLTATVSTIFQRNPNLHY